MYAVTSIRRSPDDPLHKFCDESATTLSPVVSQYRTDVAPTKESTLPLPHEDIIVRRDDCWRHYPRLVVFDMDSTLINEECIDLLATYAGVESRVADITRRAMAGDLDFTASLAARVALLAGLDAAHVFPQVRARITFAPGARALCRALRRMGCTLALVSGGFMPLAQYVASELGLHHVYANDLAVGADGKLTGALAATTTGTCVVHAERKRDILLDLQQRVVQCRIEQVVAVGDGANDLPMLHAAGLGVAMHAKAMVQREAPARIRFGDLSCILYLFGLSHDKVVALCAE